MGTHPMAGKEKSGYEYGNGEIFLGANFVITPTLHNRRETLDQVRAMARELGFGRIREVEPKEHDEVIAYTSHMPHALAAAWSIPGWERRMSSPLPEGVFGM
ncbi:MAG: prephenate dehydrogenase/arogenate dehydrogenase family protein [Clostridia bacterium]